MAPDPASSGAERSAGSISLSFGQATSPSKTPEQSQRTVGRLIRAPVDSDDELEQRSRSHRTASYRVPNSDSDDSDGEEVQSAPQAPWLGPTDSPELDVLRWFQEGQRARYLAVSQRTLCALQRQLMEADLETAQELDDWDRHTKKKQEDMVRAERERLRQREREREQCLRELSESQQQTAQLQQEQLKRVQAEVEAARRAKEEADRKAAEEKKRREEQERRKQQEQEKKEQEQKLKAEEAKKAAEDAAKKAEQENKTAAQATPTGAAPTSGPLPNAKSGLCISTSASEFEARVAAQLKKMEAAAEAFKNSSGTQWRTLDKAVNKHVLQISATQQQVARKSQDIMAMLRGCSSDEMRAFAFVSLANKLLKQCEVQVQQLPSFAFPLAAVTVNVATEVPLFIDVLLGRLHKMCVLAVPKYYVYKKGSESDDDYFRHMGYREVGDDAEQRLESTDQYIDRIKGYILYYAAITQVEHHANPHGLDHAWMFVARMLNSLPSNRITAAVLDSFLKVAGYCMHRQFRNQFLKLMKYVTGHFMGELQKKGDAELSAVVSRIATFSSLRQYMQEPEGRRMPQQDESEYNRA